MTLPNYAWISYGWYFTEFWKTPFENRSSYDSFDNCTHSDLKRIVDRMIVIHQYSRQDDGDSEIIIGGLVSTGTGTPSTEHSRHDVVVSLFL